MSGHMTNSMKIRHSVHPPRTRPQRLQNRSIKGNSASGEATAPVHERSEILVSARLPWNRSLTEMERSGSMTRLLIVARRLQIEGPEVSSCLTRHCMSSRTILK